MLLKKKYNFLFIKKLSLRKLLNFLLVYLSYLFSVLFKTPRRWGYPAGISVEPSANCNLQCPECPRGTGILSRQSGNMPFALYKNIIDELAPYLMNVQLFFQGEPFLNKEIFDFIDYASLKNKLFTIISTNGHFLDENTAQKVVLSGLDKLIISLDGISPETYEKYRKGGDFNKVISGIKNIVSAKERLQSATPLIVIQFLVFRYNEDEMDGMKKLCRTLKVDKLEFKSAQIYDFENNTNIIPSIEKYARYKKNKQGKYVIKSKLKNHCKRLWTTSVISNKGHVLPCCFDKDAQYSAGVLSPLKFAEINNNEKSISFRKQLLKNRKQIDICQNCSEGLF